MLASPLILLRPGHLRRRLCGGLALLLLLLQAEFALAGCLLTRALPAMEAAMGEHADCDQREDSGSSQRLCLQQCEQTANARTSPADLPEPAPVLLLASVVLPGAGAQAASVWPLQARALAHPPDGSPPVYLQSLRLRD